MSSLTGNHNSHPGRGPERFRKGPSQFRASQVHFRLSRTTSWLSKVGILSSIGWAILVPTLLGFSVGLWIDTMYPSGFHWTSLMLPVGLFLGCLNAGYWFRQDYTPKD